MAEKYREFVATHSREDIRLANPMLQRVGDALEEVIPSLVAKRVVDFLEVVEIDYEHRARAAIASRAFHLLRQFLLKPAPVEEAGQKVVGGQVFEVAFESFSLGDVLNLRDQV